MYKMNEQTLISESIPLDELGKELNITRQAVFSRLKRGAFKKDGHWYGKTQRDISLAIISELSDGLSDYRLNRLIFEMREL